MWSDLRLAWRALRAAPAYALAAALTLALGIGAAASVYSVADVVLLRPLPYQDAGRLVALWSHRDDPTTPGPPSYADVADWRQALAGPGRPFAGVAFARSEGLLLRGPDGAAGVNAAAVSDGFFGVLGGRPLLGRTFRPDEERPGAPRVAVLTHHLWQRRFGGDPGVVGRTVAFAEGPVTVVGVMPPGYEYPGRWAELWTPLASTVAGDAAARDRLTRRELRVDARALARLGPGVTPGAARAALSAFAARLAAEHPAENAGWGAHFVLLRDEIAGPVRPQLLALLGAVGLLLLVACADVANLALVRASARGPDLATRRALGATPARLARQLFAESALVAAAGGALGVLLAVGGSAALRAGAPEPSGATAVPRFDAAGVDGRVLAFAVLASALTAVLFGVAPALRAARADAAGVLRGGARGAARAGTGRRFRAGVAVAQLAVTLVLLVGAGLLGRSFLALRARDAGFPVERLVVLSLRPPAGRDATPAARAALYERARAAVEHLPGVRAAGVVNHLALTGAGVPTPVRTPGVAAGSRADTLLAWFRVADGGFFAASGIPVRRGRALDDADAARAARPGATGVPVVVSEVLARRAFGARDPLGRPITVFRQASGRPDYNTPVDGVVVGVAAEVKGGALDAAEPEAAVYVPMGANPWSWATLVVRAADGADPASLVPAVRRAVAAVEPDLPLDDLRTGATLVARATAERRFTAALFGAFALAAAALAAVGLYGVVAYGVAQRAGELGVRAALGASRGALVRLVVGEGARLAAAGVVLGVALALAASRLLASLLFGVGVRDAATYAAVAAGLGLVAVLASWLPARRAAHADPATALRSE